VRTALRARPGRKPTRRGAVAIPCLAGGLLAAVSLPPFGFWILAWLGLAVLYVRLGGLAAKGRAVAGIFAGLGLLAPSLWWATEFNAAGYVAMTLAETAMFAALVVAVPPRRGRALAFPAAVVAFQAWISSWPFGGVPVGTLTLGQVAGPFGAAARLGGPLVVTALACGAAVAAGEAWRALATLAARPSLPAVAAGRGAARSLATAGLVCAVAAAGALAPDGGAGTGTVRAALVQGGGARGLTQEEVSPSTVYHAQLAATSQVRPPVQLVLWPEDVIALPGPLAGSPEEATMSRLARALHTTLVAGVTEDVGATRFLNKAVAWGPSGSVVYEYEKIHRVPFGEYVPLRGLFEHLADLSAVPRDAIPGTQPNVMRTPAGTLGVMVSYEVFFSYLGRTGVRGGAQLLVVPTNTSSYATGQMPAQEVAASRLRAIEGGRDLLQAAPTGYSAVIDNRGRVLARSSLGSRRVILASVERRSGTTVYVRLGDWPLVLLAVAALATAWALAGSARRRVTSVS
jgi:apolipoprotein N-acyltransferase